MDIGASNTVLIPGATSGIGLALATRLQQAGNTVVVGGRRKKLLDELARTYGFGTVEIDTTDPESIATAVADVVARYPQLNVLVAMAGVMEQEDWHRPDGFLDSSERVLTTNLLGPIRLIGASIEHLLTRPSAAIVTVSSGLAFVPMAGTPSYNASKAGIHMLSESLRLQLSDTNVDVVEIVPPAVRTALNNQEEAGWAMPLDEFAEEVVDIWRAAPDAHEILVERVKFLRNAEAEGRYEQTVSALNAAVSGSH